MTKYRIVETPYALWRYSIQERWFNLFWVEVDNNNELESAKRCIVGLRESNRPRKVVHEEPA